MEPARSRCARGAPSGADEDGRLESELAPPREFHFGVLAHHGELEGVQFEHARPWSSPARGLNLILGETATKVNRRRRATPRLVDN